MYKSESMLSRALIKVLREEGCFVQRIETRGTGVGVPDMFVVGIGGVLARGGVWVELKVDNKLSYCPGKAIKVMWRPGQLAWAYEYYNKSGKCAITVVACINGFVVIPVAHVFKQNTVHSDYYVYCRDMAAVVAWFKGC